MLARNLQLYKIEIIHGSSSRILVEYSTDSFTDSHFQVGSFVKHLLWHQNYFDMDYPSIFRSTQPHYSVFWRLHKPHFKWEGRSIKLWMVDRQGALRLNFSWDHCQRFSPSQISKVTNHYNKVTRTRLRLGNKSTCTTCNTW